MLKRIYIDNYRCFSNFEFKPGRINLLLGANGSGKTCLFEVLQALVATTSHGALVSELFPPSSRTRWDMRTTQRVEIDLTDGHETYRYLLVLRHEGDPGRERTVIGTEEVSKDGKTLFLFEDGTVHLFNNDGEEKVQFPFRGDSSFLSRFEHRPESRELRRGLDLISQLQLLRLDTRAIGSLSTSEEQTLSQGGENFASWYRHLQQESTLTALNIFGQLKEALPGFCELKLISAGQAGRARELAVRFSLGADQYDVYMNELSDGQRALIVLYSLLEATRPADSILLLDEPGAHISLQELQPWLRELNERFSDRGQLFVISHHPEVVDYLAASEPWYYWREQGGPTQVRPAEFDRDSGMYASKQIQLGLLDD